jgi:hypothetical protein
MKSKSRMMARMCLSVDYHKEAHFRNTGVAEWGMNDYFYSVTLLNDEVLDMILIIWKSC